MRAQTGPHHQVNHPEGGRDPAYDTATGPGQWHALRLDRTRGSGPARVFTRRCLDRWGVDDQAPFWQDAVLVVSELVTNAQQHAEVAEALRLRWQPPMLVIEVQDRGSGMPRVRPLTEDLPGGRGLTIVSKLVQRCHVVLGALGRKTVRVEMRCCAQEAAGA